MAKLKITQTDISGQVHDSHTGPENVNGAYVGGTGGLTSQAGSQIQPTVKVGSAGVTTGSILAQKGIRKFRVTDGTNVSTCTLVNLATPTAADTMSIQVNVASLSGATITAYTASTSTVSYVTGFTQTGPVALAAGQVVTGTGFTGVVTIGSLISASNVALSYTSQNNANVSGVVVSATVNASRITNRFVTDFASVKYRYHLATPDATFVEVKYA